MSRSSTRHVARQGVAVAVGCAIAALVANTWLVEGLFAPLIVQGSSMAPGLLGACQAWRCAACGESFACLLDTLPAGPAACPHCGAAAEAGAGVELAADRLLIDRSAFAWREPRRWETVVARAPDDSGPLVVKRVVGLPGETVQIVDGDVRVDGRPARKSLAELRDMAVPVSGAAQVARWHDESGAWSRSGTGFVHAPRGDALDWLAYQHFEASTAPISQPGQPILDACPFDQSESRRLNPVPDVLLGCRFVPAAGGRLSARSQANGDDLQATLEVDSGRIELVHNGKPVAAGAARVVPGASAELELAVADQRVLVAVAGQVVVRYDFERTKPSSGPASMAGPAGKGGGPASQAAGGHLLAVGAAGPLQVRHLRLRRDLYYLPGPGGQATQYRLAAGEYFLLGDHAARSLDSRGWPHGGALSRDLLVGRAIAWPARTQ